MHIVVAVKILFSYDSRSERDSTEVDFFIKSSLFLYLYIYLLNQEKEDVLLLWYHENCRVFQDRMVNDKDRSWFDELLCLHLVKYFSVDPKNILGTETILYGDFLLKGSDVKNYQHVTDMTKVSNLK